MLDDPISSRLEVISGWPYLPGFEPETSSAVKPFLRWAGGKSRLLDAILPHVPMGFQTYHEPFLGSGAVFFAVRGRAARGCVLGDLNTELINTWQVVRDQPEKFLAALEAYKGRNSEEDYYLVRAAAPTTKLARAARFFYLNQTAWNGLWRENKHGVFNVPWGNRPFRGIDQGTVEAVTRCLRPVDIDVRDFRAALEKPTAGDFVYMDPPYLPVSDTSKFSGYNGQRFRATDLKELAEGCKELSARGVTWILSNRDTPLVRELFAHGRIVRFTTWRSVSAQNKRNVEPSASPEVLIIGGPR